MKHCAAMATLLVLTVFTSPSIGGVVALSNVPDYDWHRGCSPTSAGMLLGYYDRNGYDGLDYDNLVAGGVAELSTFGGGSYIANDAIASSGHVADFFVGSVGSSGDDVPPPHHDFNCLADFMGTSQDSAGNPNGSTTFWYRGDGGQTTLANIDAWNEEDSSGLWGIDEYVEFCGYDTLTAYNQLTDNESSSGATFADFQAEIDAGRPALIHIEDHTMLGYGYDTEGDLVYVHDTWDEGGGTMTWGGEYDGSELHGVTFITLTGGAVPEPSTFLLAGCGVVLVIGFRRRRKKA